MWKIIVVSCGVLLGAMNIEAATGSYAGSYAGTNAGTGGYTGNYNDYDDYGAGFLPFTNFGTGFIDPYAFHQQLTSQILAQHAAQQNAIASTFTQGDSEVYAGASNMPDYYNDDDEQHRIFANSIRRQNSKGGHRYGNNYAAASGSIGPNGAVQTAHISPQNPASPNIVNRFSSASPGGYKGVSVSSFSSSSDINGKRTSHRGAQTTINDNGRVTTYKVQS